jgi:hypothetical protein
MVSQLARIDFGTLRSLSLRGYHEALPMNAALSSPRETSHRRSASRQCGISNPVRPSLSTASAQ